MVSVGVWDALDEAVFTQSPEVIGGLAWGDRAGMSAEVFGEQLAEVFAEEPARVHPKHQQDMPECLCAGSVNRRPAMRVPLSWRRGRRGVQDVGSGDGIVAESLDGRSRVT